MSLKKTSQPVQIAASVPLTIAPGVAGQNTRTIDLQLSPLDNEVFVVTAVKIDFEDLPLPLVTSSYTGTSWIQASILKNAPQGGAVQSIGNSNCIASSRVVVFQSVLQGPPVEFNQYEILENGPMDSPPSDQDYLDIIATDNFVVQFANSERWSGQTLNMVCRVYGYRAKADAATYAALVQSEVLSA